MIFKMTELAPAEISETIDVPEKQTPPKSTVSSRDTQTDKSSKRAPQSPLVEEEQPKKKLRTAEGPLTKPNASSTQSANRSLAHLLAWKDEVTPPKTPEPASFRLVQVPSIVDTALEKYGENLQAILIDASWKKSTTGYLDLFKKLRLSDSLMNNGIVFVWADKEDMSGVMAHLETMGYVYVEIFSFILLSVQKILEAEAKKNEKPKMKTILDFFQKKNTTKEQPKQKTTQIKDLFKTPVSQLPDIDPASVICQQSADNFRKGKKNLIMMRKINKRQSLELRHQRTSDVYFVLYDQKLNKIDDRSYEIIYRMIETLLIKANYQPGQPLKMMELFARPATPRPGWISINQTDK